MGARFLVLIAILVAVCLAGFGVIEVDAQIVIWLLVAMAIAIVIASMTNRSGAKKDNAQPALIPATPMPAVDDLDVATTSTNDLVAAAATDDALAAVVSSGSAASAATVLSDRDVFTPSTGDPLDESVAVGQADDTDDEVGVEELVVDTVADDSVGDGTDADDLDAINTPASTTDAATDDPADGPDAEVIDIHRGRRSPFSPAPEENPVTTTARPTSIEMPPVDEAEAAVSSIRLPKPDVADTAVPSLKVERTDRSNTPTPKLAVTRPTTEARPAPSLFGTRPKATDAEVETEAVDTPVAEATPTADDTAGEQVTEPTPEPDTTSTAVAPATGTSLQPKVAAATRKAIADLVARGRLSNEGPITDADVKTIVFLAISAEEVVALVDGGYVAEDGNLTPDKARAKPFQASA